MTTARISAAIGTLRDLLVEEAKFLFGVSDQVKQAERDLKTMHSLLMDADNWSGRYDPHTSRDWVAKLQDLAFEAENVLEQYAVEVTSKRQGRDLKEKLNRFVCMLCECCSVHHVGKEIKGITARLSQLTERLNSTSGREGSSNSRDDQQHLLRLRYAHEVEQHFVGMEKDIANLVGMVKDEPRCSPVISICGIGGLGKTTLARKIYHHEDVQACFEARAWVCVTQMFEAKVVLSELLRQLILHTLDREVINSMGQRELVVQLHNVINSMEQRELVAQLHNVLMEKKCLIIIDDIWEIEHWRILEPAFPTTNCKIVLTTRYENIVPQGCVYKLDFLTEDEGWDLLQKIALPRNINDVREHEAKVKSLEDIGRQMVKKCGCLPLAISVVGGVLGQKQQTSAEWKKVSSNIDSNLNHKEGVGKDMRVKQVLDLSYNALPYYLRPCFLYLACFPEDEEIYTWRLYELWMSEGLISSEEKGSNETLRDVAERYLSELASRCMVQVQKGEIYTPHNKFMSCRLHDLMHDLCSSKAREENLLKRISFSEYPHNILSSTDTSISRLAVSVDGDAAALSINAMQKLENLRSFLVLRKSRTRWDFKIDSQYLMIDFDKSKYLRVLEFDGIDFEGGRLPSNVGKLIHLRRLSLFFSLVEELPPSVCDMPYLQSLDLRVKNTIRLPNVICKMKRLRHLFLRDFDVIGGDKLILDGLNELEALERIRSDKVCITDIPKLANLRELFVQVEDMESASIIAHHISNNQSKLRETRLHVLYWDFSLEDGESVFKNMLMSHSLVSLAIDKCKIGRGFPCYQTGMCKNLVHLALSDSEIGGDLMEILGKWPTLRMLRLNKSRLLENKMIFGANLFPELKIISLGRLSDLKKWEVNEKAMPQLTTLWIYGCENLEMIPDGLRFISTLRELESWDMPKEFNDRLRVVNGQPGEDYHKISHITSIQLDDS